MTLTNSLSAQKYVDSIGIVQVFTHLSDAWEARDGNLWGDQFTEDADFTVWFGLHLHGRKEISEGHQWVFDVVYPGTRYQFEISRLKFLTPEIAIVHLNASIVSPGENIPEDPHTLPVAVVQKLDGVWKIAMFHNMKNRIKEIEERRKKGDMGDLRH